jgi:predicted NBD/HSP70 family sugar kinase
VDDFVLVSLGNGLDVGVFVGGRLHRGASGAAGEAGYLPSDRGQTRLTRGLRRGEALESTIGARHIVTMAGDRGLPGDLTARSVFDLARAGDPAAVEVVDDTRRRSPMSSAASCPCSTPWEAALKLMETSYLSAQAFSGPTCCTDH